MILRDPQDKSGIWIDESQIESIHQEGGKWLLSMRSGRVHQLIDPGDLRSIMMKVGLLPKSESTGIAVNPVVVNGERAFTISRNESPRFWTGTMTEWANTPVHFQNEALVESIVMKLKARSA